MESQRAHEPRIGISRRSTVQHRADHLTTALGGSCVCTYPLGAPGCSSLGSGHVRENECETHPNYTQSLSEWVEHEARCPQGVTTPSGEQRSALIGKVWPMGSTRGPKWGNLQQKAHNWADHLTFRRA